MRRRLLFFIKINLCEDQEFLLTSENEIFGQEGAEEDLWGERINLTVLCSESSLYAEDESRPHWSKEWDGLSWSQTRLTVVQEWRKTLGVL